MSEGKIGRRKFLGVGLTTVVAAANAREALGLQLAPEVKAPKKGKAKGESSAFQSTIYAISGIPLGGIGTGSIELRPDGYLYDWLIFNMGDWSPEQPSHEQGPVPDMGPSSLQFFARVEQEGSPVKLRRLGVNQDQLELYSLAFAKPVQSIEYDGKFPLAMLRYHDDSLPVEIRSVCFSPLIPLDSRTSGTPGCTFAFRIKNTSRSKVTVDLMGALQNPLAWGAEDRALTNAVRREGGTTTIDLSTTATTGRQSTHGSMSLSVTGGEASTVNGGYRGYLGNGYWGRSSGFGTAYYSYLHPFYRDGRLPSLESKCLDGYLKAVSDADIEKMPDADKLALVSAFANDPYFGEFLARIKEIDPTGWNKEDSLNRIVKDFRSRLDEFSGKERKASTWGDAALASKVTLEPGEEKEVRFALSWYFPNHFSQLGPNMGHQYENWFANAAEVNSYLVKNYEDHRDRVASFAETMLSTNLPEDIAFAWSAQLTTLVKSSWWTKAGRFAIWEGLGCCGLHTTDITYQGSHNLIAFFPDLQKGQMSMGASHQRADGRIHHFFAPDLLHVDNGFDRVDMNPQFVMMVCRDYLWSNDKAYLQSLWPNVVRAMASTQKLDGDGDGIPDHDTRRNTYDQWDLEGSPSYICSLWIGALRAASRIATDLGHTDQAAEWTALGDKAAKSFEAKLWNGEYFNLWASDTGRDECCMSDQLSGEWYTNLMGLGHTMPTEKVLASLQAVHKHNFDTETGLLNATYPAGRVRRFHTDRNPQAVGNWTGIEYAIASMMIDFGLVDDGLDIIRTVFDRYARAGRRWNHVECGDHYYRAMSSWATLLALTGFKIDAPAGKVTIAPRVDDLVAPWFTTTGYGILARKGKHMEVVAKSGSLPFQRLVVPGGGEAAVKLGGKALKGAFEKDGGHLAIQLGEEARVEVGKPLVVSLA